MCYWLEHAAPMLVLILASIRKRPPPDRLRPLAVGPGACAAEAAALATGNARVPQPCRSQARVSPRLGACDIGFGGRAASGWPPHEHRRPGLNKAPFRGSIRHSRSSKFLSSESPAPNGAQSSVEALGAMRCMSHGAAGPVINCHLSPPSRRCLARRGYY